ncbi:MAG: class I SAM-dependent methyltransferase [Candidatus Gastranaerophilales bacterium]|nr:class I SAM-dependent methyltransferase [Candidatus Gastranaerophilales bacterium]
MSEICKNWSTWLKKTRFSYMDETQVQQTLNWLLSIRNQVLLLADIKAGQKVADFGCGSGLLGFGVLEHYKDSVELIFSDKFQDCLDECKNILSQIETPYNVSFLQSDVSDIKLESNYLDRAMTRSVLVHVKDKQPCFNEFYRVLKPQGYYCAFEPIISENTRYYELVNEAQISDYQDFKLAEKEFMENPNDPLVNFSAQSLDKNLEEAGFSDVLVNVQAVASKYIPTKEAILNWFIAPPAPDQKTMKERFLQYFEEKKVDNFILEVQNALGDTEISVSSNTALIKAIK